MIVKRKWARYARYKYGQPTRKYVYHGWFLFGFIPLYIDRINL